MFTTPLTKTLIIVAGLLSQTACNTVQGVKQDAYIAKDKAVQSGKAAGQAVGSSLQKASEAVKGATN